MSCDFGHLQEEIDSVAPYVDGLHIDVMDGHFVPNLSFGAPVFSKIKTDLPLSAHLMVTNPEAYVEEYAKRGVTTFLFHVEPTKGYATELIAKIREVGMKPGVVLNPDTPVADAAALVPLVDEVLLMSVFPGFGGQDFIPSVLEKVPELRALNTTLTVSIDGGVNKTTSAQVREAGIDIAIAGSYIYKAPDRQEAIARLRGEL